MDDVSSETCLKMNFKRIVSFINAISYFVLLRSLDSNNNNNNSNNLIIYNGDNDMILIMIIMILLLLLLIIMMMMMIRTIIPIMKMI